MLFQLVFILCALMVILPKVPLQLVCDANHSLAAIHELFTATKQLLCYIFKPTQGIRVSRDVIRRDQKR